MDLLTWGHNPWGEWILTHISWDHQVDDPRLDYAAPVPRAPRSAAVGRTVITPNSPTPKDPGGNLEPLEFGDWEFGVDRERIRHGSERAF